MNIQESARFAVQGVTANKVRSALTTLGILIGVAAVIILADAAVPVSQIDATRARESVDLIQARLAELPAEAEDEREEMIRDLGWHEVQLKAAEKRGRG